MFSIFLVFNMLFVFGMSAFILAAFLSGVIKSEHRAVPIALLIFSLIGIISAFEIAVRVAP